MVFRLDQIKFRILTKGLDGKFPPIITGEESDEDLRRLALEVPVSCPLHEQHDHCPFMILGGLSRHVVHDLVAGMNREALLFLFASEHECRNRAMT